MFQRGEEEGYYEAAPGVNIEYDKNGKPIGIEVLDYSKLLVRGLIFKNEKALVDIPYGLKDEISVRQVSNSNIINL